MIIHIIFWLFFKCAGVDISTVPSVFCLLFYIILTYYDHFTDGYAALPL